MRGRRPKDLRDRIWDFYSEQVPLRYCQRAFGRSDEGRDNACELPATRHIILQETKISPTLFLCATHYTEYQKMRTPYFKAHKLGSDCGMPNAVFIVDKNKCIVTWPSVLAEEDEVGLELPIEVIKERELVAP